MFLFQSKNYWTVYAPAKINLFFEVYGKRTDGFHEITSVALPIRLCDILTFEATRIKEATEQAIDFACENGTSDIPADGKNIVVRAVNLLRQRAEVVQGAKIRLFKRIPSQSGLGGGSSDAVSALFAARCAWNLTISDDELLKIAREIGSDCPIFFHRGISLSRGRGEKIQFLESTPKLHFVVLKPAEGLSTATVFAEWMANCHSPIQNPDKLLKALKCADPFQLGSCFFNRLEEPAKRLWFRFDEIYHKLKKRDCLAVRMSGSGTAFYGLCRNARHARFVAAQLRQQMEPNDLVFEVESC